MIESETAQVLRDIRILYVDDEEFVVRSMKMSLGRVFGKVYTALNGVEGFKQYKEYHPELVITDITMPGMDGYQMIQKIRKLNPGTKFIVISGHNGSLHMEKSRELGAIHITKPIEKEELVRAIEKSLGLDLSLFRK